MEKALLPVKLPKEINVVGVYENTKARVHDVQIKAKGDHTRDTSFLRARVVFLVSQNINKFNEARHVLADFPIAVALLKMRTLEIQDNDLNRIAEMKAFNAMEQCKLPLLVEDAGLFIKALSGFPGSYSSFVYQTIGTNGILKLMTNIKERDAYFQSAIVYSTPEKEPKAFTGRVTGTISDSARGTSGFGFDPIFEPAKGHGKTFAEMTLAEKNRFSHRAKALRNFAQWYTSQIQRRF